MSTRSGEMVLRGIKSAPMGMKSATDEGAEVSRTCTQQHLSRCSQLTILPSTANQRPPPRELNLSTWYKVHRDMLKKRCLLQRTMQSSVIWKCVTTCGLVLNYTVEWTCPTR